MSDDRKVTGFRQSKEDARRLRAAYLSLPISERPPKLEAFVNDAVMEKVRALEVERNGGEPFVVPDVRVSPGRKPQV